jgi:hypothetical protein
MIPASIESMSQVMSFTDGSMVNELHLRLPNGQLIRVGVQAEDMQAVTALFVAQGGPAVRRAVSAVPAPPPPAWGPTPDGVPVKENLGGLELEHGENQEFGGDYAGPPDTTDDSAWVPSAPTPLQTEPVRVSADAKGNPVVHGGMARTDMAGGRNAEHEEDGVGSI